MEFSYEHVFSEHTKSSCYAEHSNMYQFKTAIFCVENEWVFSPILLKKILNLNLHESLDDTISHNFHFDTKIVHMWCTQANA